MRDKTKCLGFEAGGDCVRSCPIGATKVKDGKIIFNPDKCIGCELFVTTCNGHARQLTERKDYGFDEVMNRSLLLAGKYGRP